ncbi:HyaD/HybD family hydrogenase maturation endopeptidase [Hydrogenimonas sp.]
MSDERGGIVVIGVGNILFRDEGVGIYAARYLEENYEFSPPIEIVDGGTLGFKLMGYYQSYERVLIVDTVSIEDEPGAVYNLPSDVLMGLGSYRNTAHEVEVVEMLEICSMLDQMAEVSVIGIVPEDIESVEISLTPRLRARFENLVGEILRELEKNGVTTKAKAEVPLDRIIHEYSAPTMAQAEKGGF